MARLFAEAQAVIQRGTWPPDYRGPLIPANEADAAFVTAWPERWKAALADWERNP